MEVVTVRWDRKLGLGAAGAALAMVAGCGGGTGGSSGAGGTTVSARDIPGVGSTLVDPAGKTLYFSDQEADGQVKCVADCLSFWLPMTVSTGAVPTAGTGVGGRLATVVRPDGSAQVTYDGKPLYTFTQDGGVGKAGGNGFRDSFGGVDFVWHAAAASGSASGPADTGGNGYGY
jgi:predicted lipoprotein with Yx(FWY)xxD motif